VAIENQGNKQKKVMTAAAYHKACVEKIFSTLPCTDVEKIVAFDTALLRVFHFDLTFEIFAGAFPCRVKCAQKNV